MGKLRWADLPDETYLRSNYALDRTLLALWKCQNVYTVGKDKAGIFSWRPT